MLKSPLRSVLEVLESRIAPAAFYVSGNSLQLRTAAGMVHVGDYFAQIAAGVDLAVLLEAGDRVVFDPDGVVSTHQSDHPWVTVTAGKAVAFFKDLNQDQRFSLDELTGLAVSDRFSGSVFSDIHGSVATMLAPNGLFTANQLHRASISKLTISGALVSATDGYTNIMVGGDLSNLSVLGRAPGGLSVNGVVATGNAALGLAWGFGGPAAFVDPGSFQYVPGGHGGDVTNARFTGGVGGIFTGDGVSSDAGQAGRGGNLVNVTLGNLPKAFQLRTGAGGDSGQGRGGAGGNIIGFRGAFHSPVDAALLFSTGAGGDGVNGDGGAGGGIANSSFRAFDPALSVTLRTGEGGASSGRGNGGNGGSMVNTGVLLIGDLGSAQAGTGDLNVLLGKGGDARELPTAFPAVIPSGRGGAGGSWSWIPTGKNAALLEAVSGGTNASLVAQGLARFHLEAGPGGHSNSSVGGAGGSIIGGRSNFLGALGGAGFGDFKVLGGAGGHGPTGGGDAGGVQGATFSFARAVHFENFRVGGGAGGTLRGAVGGAAGGGDGGALRQLVFDFQEKVTVTGELSFRGGLGGENGGRIGDGGRGGAIESLAILSKGELAATLLIHAGSGGGVGAEAALPLGAGGAGGGLSNLLLQAPKVTGLSFATGDGGQSTGLGRGGRGGDFSTGLGLVPHPVVDLGLEGRLRTPAGVYVSGAVATFLIELGDGGRGGSGNGDPVEDEARTKGGSGGHGGSLFNSTFVLGGLSSELLVAGGGGGTAENNGNGGVAGRLDRVSFHVHGNTGGVRLALSPGGDAEDGGLAGAGRGYSNLEVVVAGHVAGPVIITAPVQGNGGPFFASLPGGAGGAIDRLTLKVGNIFGSIGAPQGNPSGTYSLQITASDGQDGRAAGAGGGITNSSITTGVLTGGALLIAGEGGFSGNGPGALGGSIAGNLIHLGDLGGKLVVSAGRGGIGMPGGGPLAGRGGSVSNTAITLQGARDVSIKAGDAGLAFLPAGQSGGAIDRLTLINTGPVGTVLIEGGQGEGPTLSRNGPGGAVTRSTYSNLGGADSVVVRGGEGGSAGDLPGFPPTFTAGGTGGAVTDFTFNNTATLKGATFIGGAGGSVYNEVTGSTGAGGSGGAVTRFVLHDATGSTTSSVTIAGGAGGNVSGSTGRAGAGGAAVATRLDTLGHVTVVGGLAGEVSDPSAPTVGGAGGSVVGVTGQVGWLSVYGGAASEGYVGGAGGSVSGVNLSEVTGFVRAIQGGNGGDGAVPGAGGSISGIVVPGDIGDFRSAFGLSSTSMGGLIAGGGGQSDSGRSARPGSVSSVTASRIAAIFAVPVDGSRAVASITAVRATVIGADTGLPGAIEIASARGYGTYTAHDASWPIDGPVVVRASGYTASSLSVIPLFLILGP